MKLPQWNGSRWRAPALEMLCPVAWLPSLEAEVKICPLIYSYMLRNTYKGYLRLKPNKTVTQRMSGNLAQMRLWKRKRTWIMTRPSLTAMTVGLTPRVFGGNHNHYHRSPVHSNFSSLNDSTHFGIWNTALLVSPDGSGNQRSTRLCLQLWMTVENVQCADLEAIAEYRNMSKDI